MSFIFRGKCSEVSDLPKFHSLSTTHHPQTISSTEHIIRVFSEDPWYRGSHWCRHSTMSKSSYSLLFPLSNTLFHGNSSSLFGCFSVSPAQLIAWWSSVSEQIIVHPEGLPLYPLPGQKLVSIGGTPSIRTWGNPSNWEKLFLFWHTHAQPYVSYPQGWLLRHLPLWQLTFRY